MEKNLFEIFYEKNWKRAVNVLRKMGITDAEDIAQNTFLYFLLHPDKFVNEKSFWHTLKQRGRSEMKRQKILKEKFG